MDMPKLTRWLLFKKFLTPVLLLGGITIAGTVGYVVIDDYPWIDALYMTVITIATVGFGEIHPLSSGGRIFTIILIFSSLGLVAYYISLFTRLLLDGEWRQQYRLYLQIKKISGMEQHVIVCGYGRNGRQACEVLFQNKITYTVIEQRPSHIADAGRDAALIIAGDATKDEVLEEAGIHKAKALITALPNDSDNLFVVLTARQMNPQLIIISRASDDHTISKLKIAGATNVIMPDKLGGAHMASLVMIPDVHEFLGMLSTQYNEKFQLAEIECNTSFELGPLNLWMLTGCTILGIRKGNGGYVTNPSPTEWVLAGERLIIMGNANQVAHAKRVVSE